MFVLGLHDIQFGTALNAHGKLLAALGELALQCCNLVLLLKCLQAEVDALLLHLYLLFMQVTILLLPLFAFLIYGTQQVGVAEHEDGVALLQHCTLITYYALYIAVLKSIQLYCHYGVHKPFHFDELQERSLDNFGYAYTLLAYAAPRRRDGKHYRVHEQGNKGCARNNVHQVLTVPWLRW